MCSNVYVYACAWFCRRECGYLHECVSLSVSVQNEEEAEMWQMNTQVSVSMTVSVVSLA